MSERGMTFTRAAFIWMSQLGNTTLSNCFRARELGQAPLCVFAATDGTRHTPIYATKLTSRALTDRGCLI